MHKSTDNIMHETEKNQNEQCQINRKKKGKMLVVHKNSEPFYSLQEKCVAAKWPFTGTVPDHNN